MDNDVKLNDDVKITTNKVSNDSKFIPANNSDVGKRRPTIVPGNASYAKMTVNQSSKKVDQSRPSVVIPPENNHFTNNNKNKMEQNRHSEKPLILLVGDSIIKNVTSYDLRKECKDVNIMVRPYRGGKVKNVKNLIIDILEDDVKPTAICIHASTNDIGSGKSVDNIVVDIENLINLVQNQGIMPILSLPTVRNDKFLQKINVLNGHLVELCKSYGIYFIEHRDIKAAHLNSGGLHIALQFNYILNANFAKCFNYLLDHI